MNIFKATVIADASWDHVLQVGGWASRVTVDGQKGVGLGGVTPQTADSSTACEVFAALMGIKYALSQGANSIMIQSDCAAVVTMFAGPYHPMFPGIFLCSKHVRGHTRVKDDRSNSQRWCDKVAKNHMRSARVHKTSTI